MTTVHMMPVVRIQTSFEKWQEARKTASALKERIKSQDAVLTPDEAMISPSDLETFTRLFVRAWRMEFCRQVLMCRARWGASAVYEVYAAWDPDELVPTPEADCLQCNVLWDRMDSVGGGIGFTRCIMVTNVMGSVETTTPIPMDSVESVKGLVPMVAA